MQLNNSTLHLPVLTTNRSQNPRAIGKVDVASPTLLPNLLGPSAKIKVEHLFTTAKVQNPRANGKVDVAYPPLLPNLLGPSAKK
jgi:hypothetical protein